MLRGVEARLLHFARRQLAIVIGDFLEIGLLGNRLHLARCGDGFEPILFLLVNLQQMRECLVFERRAVEPCEQFLRTVEQAGAMKILRQFIGDGGAFVCR